METSLTSVSGIGPAAAAVLAEHGFTSADQLAASVVEDLVKVPGFGPVRAAATLRSARSLVEGRADAEAAARPGGKSAKPGKGKKVKKKTKDKKKERKAASVRRSNVPRARPAS
jgi:predicted RecB family nuclease